MRGLLLAVLLAAPAAAQRTGEVGFTVENFGGLDVQRDSARISDFDATSADNVLTDTGRMCKREGNVRMATMRSGFPNKAIREFVPASQTRYVATHAGDNVYVTDLSGTITTLSTVTTGANVDMTQALNTLIVQDGQATPWTWNTTSTAALPGMPTCKFVEYANERVYCGNIPSASNSRVAVSSYGSIGYFTVPANVAAIDAAPNTFDFQREDGDQITCLKATRCGVFVGKNRSTHIIKGYDNFTFRKDIISENIGCQDDRSVQTVDGNIVWLAQDGVYSWPCAGKPEPISRDIDPLVKAFRQNNSFSATWVLNTQTDFESGNTLISGAGGAVSTTLDPGSVVASTTANIDTSTSDWSAALTSLNIDLSGSGEIRLTSTTVQDDWGGATIAGRLSWAEIGGTGFFTLNANRLAPADVSVDLNDNIATSSVTYSTGSWKMTYSQTGNLSCSFSVVCWQMRFMVNAGGDYYALQLKDGPLSQEVNKRISIVKGIGGVETELTQISTPIALGQDHTFEVQRTTDGRIYAIVNGIFVSSTPAQVQVSSSTKFQLAASNHNGGSTFFDNFYFYQYAAAGSLTSRIFDTHFSTPTHGALSSTFTVNSGAQEGGVAFYVQVSTAGDGGGFDSLVSSSDTLRPAVAQKRYFRYRADFVTNVPTSTPVMMQTSLAAATSGYYYSPIKFVGTSISAYGALDFLESLPSGSTISYWVRSATYSFPTDTEAYAWTSIFNHATVPLAISTPTYFQYRALLAPSSGDQIVAIERSQLGWNEGAVSPPVASGWKDGRYFLCATISTSTVYPDTCFVYQRNKKWVTFSGFSAASIAPYSRDLMVGSGGTDGYVWKMLQHDVYNDDGSAIASTWVSKDFMFSPNGRDWAVGEKAINEVWLDTEVSSSTYLTVGYAVNKSTAYLTGSLDLGAYGDTVNKMIPFTSMGRGKYTRLKLYNADLDKAIKINGYSIFGEPNPKTQE